MNNTEFTNAPNYPLVYVNRYNAFNPLLLLLTLPAYVSEYDV